MGSLIGNKEYLNINKDKQKEMEEIYKEDYKALKECAIYTKIDLLKQKQDGQYSIDKKEEKRLKDLGYIDFNENSTNLYHPEHILTIKGEEQYLKLKEINHKNWAFWFGFFALIIAIISLYFTGKSQGWWS